MLFRRMGCRLHLKKIPSNIVMTVLLYLIIGLLLYLMSENGRPGRYSNYHNELVRKFSKSPKDGLVTEQQYYENYVNLRVPAILQDDKTRYGPQFVNRFAGEIPAKVHELGKLLVEKSDDKYTVLLAKSQKRWERKFTGPQKWKHSYALTLGFTQKLLRMGYMNPVIPFSWRDWSDAWDIINADSTRFLKVGKFPYSSFYRQDPKDFLATTEPEAVKIVRGAMYTSYDNVPVDKIVFVSDDRNIEMKVQNVGCSKSAVFDKNFGMLGEIQTLEGYDRSIPRPKYINLTLIYEELFGSPKIAYFDNLDIPMVISTTKQSVYSPPTYYRGPQFAEYLSLPRLETRSNDGYHGPNDMTVVLESDDFKFNLTARIEELSHGRITNYYRERLLSLDDSRFLDVATNEHYQRLLNSKSHLGELQGRKFFNEIELASEIVQLRLLGTHHDWRFFKGIPSEEDKLKTLHRLARAWQIFAANEKIIYWLAHGNLLSWKWQGTNFAWDRDIDVQLPIKHLEYLAANFNESMIVFEDEGYVGRYYLEISPLFWDKDNKGHKNTIDGRFIDVDTGHYIDLTAIFFKDTDVSHVDDNGFKKGSAALVSSLNFYAGANMLTDKNSHSYPSISSLSPLRKTIYEGAVTYVPFDVDKILIDEYPEGLLKREYTHFYYDDVLSGWLSKRCYNCDSKQTLQLWKDHKREARASCALVNEGDARYCNIPGEMPKSARWFTDLLNVLERESQYYEVNGYPYVRL